MSKAKSFGELKRRLSQINRTSVTIGWLANTFYPEDPPWNNGESVAHVASLLEYGGVSKFADTGEETLIPPRPFFHPAIDKDGRKWIRSFSTRVKGMLNGERESFSSFYEVVKDDIQTSIESVTTPPLALYTILRRIERRRQGSDKVLFNDKPLIETGFLLSSIKFKVKRR